jgi:hypothetical protein
MMLDDPRIEKVARALCRHDGRDPDAMSTDASSINFNVNPNNPQYPRWRDYIGDAREFVVMHDALNA